MRLMEKSKKDLFKEVISYYALYEENNTRTVR